MPRSTESLAYAPRPDPRASPVDLAVLVPSCDAYSDVWPSFFDTLFKRWSDCPFRVYLVSNFAEYRDPRVQLLQVGEDRGWSANLKTALDAVPETYVLLTIDDLYPTARIDTVGLVSLIEEIGDFDYLRLNPYPGPRKRLSRRVGLVPPGDVYRTSTVFSVWRREVLHDLLVEDESPWQFELDGSKRSDRFDRWFASRRWLVPYLNLVVKRKIDPLALLRLRRSGVAVHSPRQLLTPSETLLLRLKGIRSRVFGALPWQLQRRIRGNF